MDTAIRVLMKAGAYNHELRRAYEDHEDITAAGTRDARTRTRHADPRVVMRVGTTNLAVNLASIRSWDQLRFWGPSSLANQITNL